MKTRRNEINYDDFEIEDGALVKYRGEGGDVVIPDGVTSIGYKAFYHCDDLTSVTIGNGVTEIGNNAFAGCKSLASVTIPDSVTEIITSVFAGCSSLTSVTIPDSVTYIGASAFFNCVNLTSITIPNSVKEIHVFAFGWCKSLKSVTIGTGVKRIDKSAFFHCSNLKTIHVANEDQKEMLLDGDNDFPRFTRIVVKGESSEEELNESRKVRLTLGQLRRLVKESDDDPIGAALRKRTHDCAVKIEEAIVSMLDLYLVPNYKYQSDEFRHCFDDVIGILDEVRALISLTDA